MGQGTYALMFGVKEDDCERWCGEDGDGGILGAFRESMLPKIRALDKAGIGYWAAERRFVPKRSCNDIIVWGFAIACGGSGIKGVPLLETMEFGAVGIGRKYPKAFERASRRWRRFARFCRAQGFKLPPAKLWLVEMEVA